MNKHQLYLSLSDCIRTDPNLSSLSYELAPLRSHHVPLVNGLLIFPTFFFEVLYGSGTNSKVLKLLNLSGINSSDTISQKIGHLIQHVELSKPVFTAFKKEFDNNQIKHQLLAVSLPATPSTTFTRPANMIKGASAAFSAIRHLWAASITPTKINYYHETHQFSSLTPPPIALLELKDVTASGSIFLDPDPSLKKAIYTVHVTHGLSYLFNPNFSVPNMYKLERGTGSIVQKHLITQENQLSSDRYGHLSTKPVKNTLKKPLLTDSDLLNLLPAIQSLKQSFMIPHQLIFIKNNRGLSFINSAPFHPFPQSQNDGAAHVITKNLPVLYQGVGVSAGVVGGPLKILNSVRDLTNVSQGDIVIIPEANSLYTPILENCAGIVALQGGASSHLSILARESVIPMIIATATQAMRWQHKSLTIDGGLGVIYAGISSVLSQTPSKLTANSLPVQTVTKRFYDASIQKISETTIPSDSSGISLNGNSFIQTNNNQALFNPPSTLVTNTLTSLLPSKPCIYQISDPFNVVDQSRQVDSVTNPLLGNRGVYAYLQQSSVIKSEVDWLKQFKQAHTQALYLIFPLTRTVDELIRFKRLLSASGLSRSPKLKLIASLDTPANVQNLEDVNRIGFDGISLNLNHLIPLWLGFDPYDIHFHDSLYQFRPSIATIIKTCLESAHDYKFFSHIRGFALTTNTEYLDLAVDVGVTAVTIPPSEWGHAAATIQFKEERRILP